MNKIRFTKSGLAKIQIKLKELNKQRPLAVLDLKKARDMGDLSENGYYKSAKAKLGEIDRNLRYFNNQLKNAVLVNRGNNESVGIESKVKLSNGDLFEIVGDMEANPREKKISLLSPIGNALKGKKVGDKIKLKTPKGIVFLQIISIN